MASTLALETGGKKMRYTSRCFGSSGECPRRTLVITYKEDFDGDDPDFVRKVVETVGETRCHVLMGWESHFSVPEGSYFLEVKTCNVLNSGDIYEIIGQGVVISRRKFLVTLAPGQTYVDLEKFAVFWNRDHPAEPISRILDEFGSIIWRHMGPVTSGPARPRDSPPPDDADLFISLRQHEPHRGKDLINLFVKGGLRISLEKFGYTEDMAKYTVYPFTDRNGGVSRALVTGICLEAARAFFWRFQDYSWSANGQGGAVILVSLRNTRFEEELNQDGGLRLRSRQRQPFLLTDSQRISAHGRLPPALGQ